MNNNDSSKKILSSTSLISSAISLVLLAASPLADAKSHVKNISQEQCAGVIKAGLSDCASVEHTCAGLNSEDSNENDWLWLPAGTCDKISNAHIIGTGKNK